MCQTALRLMGLWSVTILYYVNALILIVLCQFQGIFKNEEDLGMFDEEFQKTFQKRRADIFSEEGWDS